MNIVINDRYTLTGSPAEMAILMILMDTAEESSPEPVEDAPAPDPVEQEAEPKPAPAPKKPKKPRKAPQTDWGKARALRNAGWSYANIGRELHVSAQTVANHLGGKIDGTEGTN